MCVFFIASLLHVRLFELFFLPLGSSDAEQHSNTSVAHLGNRRRDISSRRRNPAHQGMLKQISSCVAHSCLAFENCI